MAVISDSNTLWITLDYRPPKKGDSFISSNGRILKADKDFLIMRSRWIVAKLKVPEGAVELYPLWLFKNKWDRGEECLCFEKKCIWERPYDKEKFVIRTIEPMTRKEVFEKYPGHAWKEVKDTSETPE